MVRPAASRLTLAGTRGILGTGARAALATMAVAVTVAAWLTGTVAVAAVPDQPQWSQSLPPTTLHTTQHAWTASTSPQDFPQSHLQEAPQVAAATAATRKRNITVGYLTAIKGNVKNRQGLAVSGALTYALNEVNNDPGILPEVNLVLKWNDTKGDTVIATRAITEMVCEGVAVFFGPENTCYVEAIVAQSRNIPMISYKCSDYKVSHVPTFARTEPPDTQVTKSVIALLRYYSWNKFLILYEEHWETVATNLKMQANDNNMTVNGYERVKDPHYCCEQKLPCCQGSYWYQFVQETKNKTRIYVFLGTTPALLDLMNTMQTSQLFQKGEYMVIYIDTKNIYSQREAQNYLWPPADLKQNGSCSTHEEFVKRARSLLIVVSTPPQENYENFTMKVREYNAKEPFFFTTPSFFNTVNFQKFVSIYAAYLYDSVKLYANALDAVLREQGVITDENFEEIISNGSKIMDKIVGIKYKSVTGATINIDGNGDSEGNFSVLAFKPYNMTIDGFSCSHHMVQVGLFHRTNSLLEYKLNTPTLQIDWPGDYKPEDEPSCGFDNESCPKTNTQESSIIAAGILGILLFCAGVVTMSIYRKWKIEQEIEGLLWKIDPNEIHHYFGADIVNSPSKLSLVSASVTSYESRCGAQMFAATGQYRGVVVRIKELKFSKKKDISRDIMKEMRLLRDIRHDNINSFIGACVEPMRILLVTDYCTKGSLYDIVENEDIRLDNMFVTSLVHDLIRGMLYIHNSMLVCHGNLKSSNCVVTSRWMLQVTDFGLNEMRHCAENDSIGEHQYYRSLFWKAPEFLRDPNAPVRGTPKGDIYAFAIILYEIIGRKGPFGLTAYEPKEIIEFVKQYPKEGEEPFRPSIDLLLDTEMGCEELVLSCIKDCWSENPELRPDFVTIRTRLKKMMGGKHKNIMDELMVKYADNLEDLVNERTRLLIEEKHKTEDLLHRMLPEFVAKRLTKGDGVEPESFDLVTIYFSDIVGFTAMSAESSPLQVVNFLNDLYTVFDQIIKGYDVYKVETIGDAYMVVSGLPIRNGDTHAGEIASMALDLLSAVKKHTIAHRPNETLKLRIGIHTGPVVAGVVGLTMPRYCLFGDTVNTASRMESNGEALKIHISEQCKESLDKIGGYIVEDRGLVNMKGKGEVLTYWLVGASEKAIQPREVDLAQLPPLFCRPRRSPKLNTDSRQASICGALGFSGLTTNRRHSSVPRGATMDIESTSTLHNSSPLPPRNFHKRLERFSAHIPNIAMSKLSLSTCAFGSEVSDTQDGFCDRRPIRPRTVLSSIASSADEHKECIKSQSMLNKIRESKSMDMISTTRSEQLDHCCSTLKLPRRSSSLENCDKCKIGSGAIVSKAINNNSFPNGNVLSGVTEDNVSVNDDMEVPLLRTPSLCGDVTVLHRRRTGNGTNETDESQTTKRWRSLEAVSAGCEQAIDNVQNRKQNGRNSLKNWLVGLFNGNGLRASNASLRNGVLTGYNDLQTEKESIV